MCDILVQKLVYSSSPGDLFFLVIRAAPHTVSHITSKTTAALQDASPPLLQKPKTTE